MYFYDPLSGNRRRAFMRERSSSRVNDTGAFLDVATRDLRNRMVGAVAEFRYQLLGGHVGDDVLARRVKSKAGRYVSHPSSLAVTAQNGMVMLTGPILSSEADGLLGAVASIPGVKKVVNRLEPHVTRDNVPGLQGGKVRTGDLPDIEQRRWAPATRLLVGTWGAYMAQSGLRRSGLKGLAQALAGGTLLARAATDIDFSHIFGFGDRNGLSFQKTMTFDVPLPRLFEFFSHWQNFPLFMHNVREVQDLGNGRSHWVVQGPPGTDVTWNAAVTRFEPNHAIAWKSEPGSVVPNAGIVYFEELPSNRSRATIRMVYNPPAGVFGHAIASIFGTDVKSEMDADLARVKTYLETGKSAHDAAVRNGGRPTVLH